MKLRAIGDDVIIHPIDNPELSHGGIHLPQREKRKVINQGLVIAKGPEVREELDIADHVLFTNYTGSKISLASGGIFFVIPERFIIAVMTGSEVVLVDTKMMKTLAREYSKVIVIEENTLMGGFGSNLRNWCADNVKIRDSFHTLGIPDEFVVHGPRNRLLDDIGLSPEKIADYVLNLVGKKVKRSKLKELVK